MANFKNFFKPQTEKKVTNFEHIVKMSINLLESYIKKTKTNININIKALENFRSYENELVQVVINIIKNAIEAYPKEGEKIIEIIIDGKKLMIHDFAGGIPQDIIDKIFDQYFSTKGEKGTGLGLYMSKIIIEEHCNGKISVENANGGARFTIEI
jgi:signal transduction histidine kinase